MSMDRIYESCLDTLAAYMAPGKTIVFLGSSGVGKSSLVNALAGKEIMVANGIREDDSKGRHTTTHRQLIMLKNEAVIIDTPGMRELGMWDVSEGLVLQSLAGRRNLKTWAKAVFEELKNVSILKHLKEWLNIETLSGIRR